MPSQSFLVNLEACLADAEQILIAHEKTTGSTQGRKWGVGGLNRAALLMCVAGWEAYVESAILEIVQKFRPRVPYQSRREPIMSFRTEAERKISEFNTPNSDNVTKLFKETLEIENIYRFWRQGKLRPDLAVSKLNALVNIRHEIIHGKMPRPTVSKDYVRQSFSLVKILAHTSDEAIRQHVLARTGIDPWPRG